VARERQRCGLTQERLAERIAMSRAGLSHLEGGFSLASERTVVLLAGVFRLDPHELVGGTDYPAAKADRLPLTALRYGEVDLQLALLDNDLAWCRRHPDLEVARGTVARWRVQLDRLTAGASDPADRLRLDEARRSLA
jgi:transcriptional regulator with XRE-family HTH domain